MARSHRRRLLLRGLSLLGEPFALRRCPSLNRREPGNRPRVNNVGEPAVASVHCIRDPFAPFNSGIVVVPTTQGDVVDVQGANVFIENANAKGINNAYKNVLFFGDTYTARARSMYNQTYAYDLLNTGGTVTVNNPDGLFPINIADRTATNRFANEGSPWDWWDLNVLTATVAATNAATGQNYDAATINATNLLSSPGMSATKGKTYVDTVINYFCPRIMRQLQVGDWQALGIKNNEVVNQLSVYPNPSNGLVTISATNAIKQVEVFDLAGKVIFTSNNYNNKCTVNTSAYNKGMYIIKVQTEDAIETTKLLVD